MRETIRMADLSERVIAGDAWHADNIAGLLADVTAAQASARPVPGVHTIWEIVLHVTGWAGEVCKRLSGAPVGTPPKGDWPAVGRVTAARWTEARDALVSTYKELQRAVAELPAADLARPVVDPRNKSTGMGASRYVTIHGAIHHATYHAGQIALLKRALHQ
jgi:uncharacterized damage-inducible protein DinB